jgi:hypothetical protein
MPISLRDLGDQLRVDPADLAVLLAAMGYELPDETADDVRGLLDPERERTRR